MSAAAGIIGKKREKPLFPLHNALDHEKPQEQHRIRQFFSSLLVIRWEYHVENFFGMVRLGCMKILFRYL